MESIHYLHPWVIESHCDEGFCGLRSYMLLQYLPGMVGRIPFGPDASHPQHNIGATVIISEGEELECC